MTKEERELALYCLKANSNYHSEVCEECTKYPNCDHVMQDDVTETIIKALESQPRWIPTSERLPEKDVEVLATTRWGEITIAERFSANNWFIHEGATNAEIDEIVAWMPLPKLYKAESGDKKE